MQSEATSYTVLHTQSYRGSQLTLQLLRPCLFCTSQFHRGSELRALPAASSHSPTFIVLLVTQFSSYAGSVLAVRQAARRNAASATSRLSLGGYRTAGETLYWAEDMSLVGLKNHLVRWPSEGPIMLYQSNTQQVCGSAI